MPVIYVNLREHDSLSNEPYVSFLRKYDIVKDDINGEQIELRVGNGKDGCFCNGFYMDKAYFKNPRLRFDFATIPSPKKEEETSIFIRASYSYEGGNNYDIDFYLQRAKEIKKRAPYFFIPGASHFEFSSNIDSEFKLLFDVIVDDFQKVPNMCCYLISLIISIFSLDN